MRWSENIVVETPRRVVRPAGRTFLVTGAGSGLGEAVARSLLRAGGRVVAVARDRVRAEETRAALAAEGPAGNIDVVACDLASRESVEALAADVAQRYEALHGIFHCAGLRRSERGDAAPAGGGGTEPMFAVEYLAPFLLTLRLLEPLRRGAPSRVVVVVPDDVGRPPWAARKLDPENLQGERAFTPLGHGKHLALARLLFVRELGQRVASQGITPVAVAPGPTRSRLLRRLPLHLRLLARGLSGLRGPQPPEKAGHHLLEVVTDPDHEGARFRYLVEGRETVPAPAARDPEAARRLWEWTEELLGERFPVGAEEDEGPAEGAVGSEADSPDADAPEADAPEAEEPAEERPGGAGQEQGSDGAERETSKKPQGRTRASGTDSGED